MSPFRPAQSRPVPARIATAAHSSTAWNSTRMMASTSSRPAYPGAVSRSSGMAPPSGKGRDGRRRRVPAAGLLHPVGDREPDQRVHHVPLVVPAGQRLDDRGLGARHAVREQPEDGRCDALHHGVDLGRAGALVGRGLTGGGRHAGSDPAAAGLLPRYGHAGALPFAMKRASAPRSPNLTPAPVALRVETAGRAPDRSGVRAARSPASAQPDGATATFSRARR